MSDSITFSPLKKGLIELKEKLDTDAPTKKNIWYVDVDLRKKYSLSFIEAGFLGMITQLQCSKQGCCRAKNYYFIDALGISDSWIEEAIKKLRDLKLIWVHYYMTKNGKRRQMVTPDSIRLYQHFLEGHKSWIVLKKFQQEFSLIPQLPGSDGSPSKEDNISSQVSESMFPTLPPNIPSGISGDGPSGISGDAINTTYLTNKKNDVTCKDPRTADSDESCSAVFLSQLEKELQQYFSDSDVAIGLAWYRGLKEERRKQMKKPIACIMRALKDGYAQKEVEAQNAQVAAETQKKRRIDHTKKLAQEEKSSNYQLAQHLISKFSNITGWTHRLDKECFIVRNDNLKTYTNEKTGGGECLMPDGSIHHGSPRLIVNLNVSNLEFRKTIKEFFGKCQWEYPVALEAST